MMEKETLGLIFCIPLLIIIIFECTLLGIAYFQADTIECTFLWCTFTTERTDIQSRINQSIHIEQNRECYKNRNKINCSELDKVFCCEDNEK